MPDAKGRLFHADVAAEFGITASDWRARVSRGHAPAPDGYAVVGGRALAVYEPDTIERYRAARAARQVPAPD